jgi:hypothetical protein
MIAWTSSAIGGRPLGVVRIRPTPAHHAAVPADQRVRRDHERRPPTARQDATQQRQPGAVFRVESWAGLLATQDVEFMTQHQDLDFVRLASTQTQDDQLDDAADGEVRERPHREETPGLRMS